MKKILQIGMTDNLGGIESFLINTYRAIDKKQFQFDFINIYDNPLCFHDEIEKNGARIFKVDSYYRHPLKYLRQVKQIIKRNGYDAIHCNMNSCAMIYPLIAAKMAGAKIIIAHAHNSSNDKGVIKTLMHTFNKRLVPKLANTYCACSFKSAEWFFNKKTRNSRRFYIIHNAIDYEKYKYSKTDGEKFRNEIGAQKDTVIVGHIGRLNKQKNHAFLVRAFNEYYKKNHNSMLVLVGSGPLEKEIKQIVAGSEAKKNIFFLGQRDDIPQILSSLDIFALPSLYEGLPLVGVEAQINGVYCMFSSNISNELSINDNNCFLDIDSESKWAAHMANYDKGRFCRKKASLPTDDTYNIRHEIKKIEAIYANEEMEKKS